MHWVDARANALGKSWIPGMLLILIEVANCKCLYGENIEIFTFSSDNRHQAVVMRFEKWTNSWTKFLHSEEEQSTYIALSGLLVKTEIELAKLFSANGVGIPFQEAPFQTMVLDREVRSDSVISSRARSDDSEFQFIATPGSTLSVGTEAAKAEAEATAPCEVPNSICESLPETARGESAGNEPSEPVCEEVSEVIGSDLPGEVPVSRVVPQLETEPAPEIEPSHEPEPVSEVLKKKPMKKLKIKKEKKKDKRKGKNDVNIEEDLSTQPASTSFGDAPIQLNPLLQTKGEKADLHETPISVDLLHSGHQSIEMVGEVVSQEAKEANEDLATPKSVPEDIQPETATYQTQPAGHTVVLKILHMREVGNQVRNAMANLPENTKVAILDSVNSYLDSNSLSMNSPEQRKIHIKYGAGRNGDIDLSALQESKWPEYLEYLRQCTGLPELTVEVMDFLEF